MATKPPHPHYGDRANSGGKCPFGHGGADGPANTGSPQPPHKKEPSSSSSITTSPSTTTENAATSSKRTGKGEMSFFSMLDNNSSHRSLARSSFLSSSSTSTSTDDENDSTGNMNGMLRWRSKGIFGKWSNKQYFVLSDGILYRFRSQKDQTAHEEIDLQPGHAASQDQEDSVPLQVVEAEGITGKKHSLGIIRRGKPTLLLCADNHRDMRRWVKNLRRAAGVYVSNKSKSEEADNQDKQMVHTLEAILDATVISDHNVRIMGFNTAAERMFGYKREEILGKSVNCLMPSMYSRFHDKYVQRYNVTDDKRLIGQPRALLGMDKAGRTFPVHLSLGEMPGPDGKNRYVAVFKDPKTVSEGNLKASSTDSKLKKESTTPTPERPYEHSKYATPMDMAKNYGVNVDSLNKTKSGRSDSSSNNNHNNSNCSIGNKRDTGPKSSFRSDTTTTTSNNEKKAAALSHPTTETCPLGYTSGQKPAWLESAGQRASTDEVTITTATEQETHPLEANPRFNVSISSLSAVGTEGGLEDHIDALPTLENLGVFIRSTKIQLVGRMMDTFEKLKHQVADEFHVLEQQFDRMTRTIEIIEEENLHMQREIDDRDREIARLRAENDNLMRTSDRYNLLQVLNNANTYKFFLDYSRQRGCSEMVLFWHDATTFKRKHSQQLAPTDEAIKEAMDIHSKYLSSDSPYEINISHGLKQFIANKLASPAPGMFDMICDDVLSSLNHDLFSEWVNTSLGKTCLSELALTEK